MLHFKFAEESPVDEESEIRSGAVESAKASILDAAVEIVAEQDGVTVSLEGVSFEAAWTRAGISRSKAYRAWNSQESFHNALLAYLAGPSWQGTGAFSQETLDVAQRVLVENFWKLQTPDGREWLLAEAIRQGAETNFRAIVASPQWRSYVCICAATFGSPDKRAILEATSRAEESFVTAMVDFFDGMLPILGYTLKYPQINMRSLVGLGAAVVEGLALRTGINPEFDDMRIDVGDDHDSWHIVAHAYYCIIRPHLELDPNYNFETAVPAFLSRVKIGGTG